MTTQNLDGQTEEASSIRVFRSVELDDRWLREGWRIAAIYEEQVLGFENETVNNTGISTTRQVLRPEARFLCVRGARKDLVALLQADVDDTKHKLAEKTASLHDRDRAIGVLQSEAQQLSRRIVGQISEIEKLHQERANASSKARKMEADFGKVRAAIGEIAFKKILGEDAKS